MRRHTSHHGIDGIDFGDQLDDLDRRDFLKAVGAATATGVLGNVSQPAGARAITNSGDGEPVIWQAFHMEWTEVESKVQLYADAGFDAIWLPQPAKCKLSWRHQAYDGKPGFYEDSHPVYGDLERHPPLGYQPVDLLDFESPYGTEAELRSLIQTAHEHDIEVILDCVLNHVATRDAPADRWGDAPDSDREWEEVTIPWSEYNFDESHMHDRGELGNGCRDMFTCSLLGLPDLDQSLPHVRDVHEQYIRKLSDVGADGLRLDAAQHVDRTHWREFYVPLFEELDLFRMGETWHANPDWCLSFADTGMHVLDFPLYGRIVDGFEKGDLYQLSQQGEQNNGVVHHDPDAAVTFVQNHDAIAPGMKPPGTPEGPLADVANAFVLSYPGTTHLFRDDLEDPELRNLIWIKRNLASGEVLDRYPGYGAYIYEREGNLLAGVNANDYEHTHTVTTSWHDQTLTDYANNQPDVTTDDSGQVSVTIGPRSWVMYAPPGQRDGSGGGGGGTASFEVAALDHPASVAAGDVVTITADVTNAGDASGTATVDLAVDGSTVTSTTVTLAAGTSTTVSFEYDTTGLGGGSHAFVVTAANGTASGTIDVTGSTSETVVAWSDPAGDDHGPGGYTPPTAGDFYEHAWDITAVEILAPNGTEYVFRIEVGGGIQDPGGWGGQGGMAHQFPQIYLRDPGSSGGATAARTGVNAELAQPYHYVLVAHGFGLAAVEDASGNTVADATLSVNDPWIELTVPASAFDSALSEMAVAPIMCAKGDIAGETRRVDATASSWNFGGGAGDSSTMGTDPNVLDVLTPSGTSQADALSYNRSSRASIPLRPVTDDGSGSDPATFDVSNLDAPASGVVGDTVSVSATVANTGNVEGTTTVELLVDGSVEDSTDVTLAAGASTSVSFEYDTTGLGDGAHTLTVRAGNASASGSIALSAESGGSTAPFAVQNFDAPASAEAGWTVYVSADIVNTGSEVATKTIEFRVDGTVVDTLDRQLYDNSQSWVQFDLDTSGLSAGTHTVTIATPDDSASGEVDLS